jgi:hypothetical protein
MEACFDWNGGAGGGSGMILQILDTKNQILHIWSSIWWKFMTGKVIHLQWPVGSRMVNVPEELVNSNDPNDHWRPDLEQLVGKQYIDWDWEIARNSNGDKIAIKFRKGKVDLAIQFLLKYQENNQ